MKHKIISEEDLVQGSQAWLDARKSAIGGSEIASVIGLNPYQSAYELWLIKAGFREAPDISDSFAIKRGHALEPKARELANDILQRNFVPCTFQSEEYPFIRYSSDGFDQNHNELIEIKCPGPKNHQIIVDTNAPLDYYMPQCQWALMITGAKVIHFISYNQEFPEPIHIVPVYMDLKLQVHLLAEAIKFWSLVETKTSPALTDKDYQDVTSSKFGQAVTNYRDALKELDKAEKMLEIAKAEVLRLSNGRNVSGNGLKVTQISRKGNIDYSQIEQLKGIDLELYRKSPSLYPKITLAADVKDVELT